MKAVMLTCHHEPTVSRAYLLQSEFPKIQIFGGIVMNQFVGGMNPAAEVALRLGAKEVGSPTIDASHHVEIHGGRATYDIQTGGDEFSWGDPITVLDTEGKLTRETQVVLKLTVKHDAILGTAHLSLGEIMPLVQGAKERGVQKILITHPFFRVPAGMNIEFLKEVARYGAMAVQDIQASGGHAVTVSDSEIMDGVFLLARHTGIFIEPAAGATVAGLVRLLNEGRISRSETVVALATGSGLKDVESVLQRLAIPASVPPDIAHLPNTG